MVFDYIILAFLVSFFVNGWMKGVFRSLIGPGCFVFFALVAIINFDLNQNLIRALVIVSAGTLISSIVIWLLWIASRRTVPMEERYYLFWGSRVLGGVITLVWRGFILAFLILLGTILPDSIIGEKIKRVMLESRSYALIQIYLIPHASYIQHVSDFIEAFTSVTWAESLKESVRFKEFMQNDKIQRILNDPQAMEDIKNKDIIKLLSNKRVMDVVNDESLMREFTYLAQITFETQKSTNPTVPVPAETATP